MDTLELLRAKFKEEPFARMLKIELLELKEGYALVEMKITEDMANIFGYAHGGSIFSLIDAAFELAANSSSTVSVALNMNVNYTKAAKAGDILRAEAVEVNSTRKTGLYEIKVKNQDKELIAICSARVYRLDKKMGE